MVGPERNPKDFSSTAKIKKFIQIADTKEDLTKPR